MYPVMADAAATAELARYTLDERDPIRPMKFRLVVEIATSLSPKIPI